MAHIVYDGDAVHSQLGFSVRHLLITRVHGAFQRWTGTFEIDPDEPSRSRVSVEIDAASVDTRNAQRDGHLRSADFFDVERFPSIRFEAREVAREAGSLRMSGDLTLHGVTKRVDFAVEEGGAANDSHGRARRGFRATGAINRMDFGIAWNAIYDGGSVVVGETVDLIFDLQLIPQASTAA